jgi:hypothetical protein
MTVPETEHGEKVAAKAEAMDDAVLPLYQLADLERTGAPEGEDPDHTNTTNAPL